jgi:CubicO group peptidase (beta-lactamase class C family)
MTGSVGAEAPIRKALETGLPPSGLPGVVGAAVTADGSEVVVAVGVRGVADDAPMHARLPDGALAPIPFAMPDPPYFQMGGGGLHSTATDYLRFLRALLGHGPPLLPPSMMALLTQSQVAAPRPGALVSAAPHLSHDFDAFPGAPTGWSLAFLVNLEPGPAGRAAGSLAWAGLSNCYYWLDPAQGVAGVLLAQTLPFGDPQALALFDRFERAVYGGWQASAG